MNIATVETNYTIEDFDVELYLSEGGDPNQVFQLGMTPLCLVNSPEQVFSLIAAGANVDGNSLTTPLHHAKNVAVMKALIAAGANVNKVNKFNETPIFFARNKEEAELLVNSGATIDNFSFFSRTVMHHLNSLELAKYLVSIGGNVNSHIGKNLYPMETIKNVSILKFFLSNGGIIPRRRRGELFNEHTTFEQLEIYLAAGASPKMYDRNGKLAIHYVQDVRSIKLLLQKKISVNCKDSLNRTPLYYVKNREVLEFLLEQKDIQLELKDNEEKNPLHVINDPELLYLLAWHGIDVNQTDIYGNTPLHYHVDSIDKVRSLISCGACSNIPNKARRTPVSYSTDKAVVSFLFYAGSDFKNLNSDCKSIWDMGDDTIKKFMESTRVELPVYNNFEPPKQNIGDIGDIPPDLIEVIKSNDDEYFEAMLDVYASESIITDLFKHLCAEKKYNFCKILLKNQKLSRRTFLRIKEFLQENKNKNTSELLNLLEEAGHNG